jgi:osmoprotectant transport system ATP-binding protein
VQTVRNLCRACSAPRNLAGQFAERRRARRAAYANCQSRRLGFSLSCVRGGHRLVVKGAGRRELLDETCGVGVIEFESVGKTYRDGTVAVVDLNLIVPSRKITVIVGPSGCGKTTTLRMVNRMLEPTTGRITWDGTPLRSKRKTTLRRQMGYVIQSGGLFPHRTVLENIGTVPSLLHWPKAKREKRSRELLSSVGLERRLAHRYPAQLSGGQQQRVGVARALAADPLVLLMDEPFSAVDPVVREELHEFLLELQRELSKTIILITHDIDEAIKLGDQVAILRIGGHLAQVGTPQQLLDEPADAFVEGFVGRDRGFRSLSFQPASALSLEGVKVVRDVETATGAAPILVVDGDARPVGWADPERPGRVFALGSTFSPETDTLRVALDSALTSPYGLAVAVTAEAGRYAGVVSADDILAKVRDVRVSIAESISVREVAEAQASQPIPEAAEGYEPLSEPEHAYDSDEFYDQTADKQADDSDELHHQMMEAEQANDSDELYDQQTESEKPADSDESYDQLGESEQADQQLYAQLGESEQADQQLYAQLGESEQRADSDQLYDQLAEPEPVSQTDTNEGGAPGPQEDVSAPSHVDTEDGDSFAGTDYPEGEIESTGDGEVPIEDHRIYDQRNEIRESNVEAWRRLGSSVLQ